MRIIIQRVKSASVSIDSIVKDQIKKGLLVFLGIEEEDSEEDVIWLSQKISNIRIFGDAENKMNLSLQEMGGDILLISQFTLHASTKKGNRPSFIKAAKPAKAFPLYQLFINNLEKFLNKKIHTGEFGAMMDISLINDGPVTIFIDSKRKE